ncbi:hypothetical protein VTI74DRAFT_11620 [Chaetomium olivicolor]
MQGEDREVVCQQSGREQPTCLAPKAEPWMTGGWDSEPKGTSQKPTIAAKGERAGRGAPENGSRRSCSQRGGGEETRGRDREAKPTAKSSRTNRCLTTTTPRPFGPCSLGPELTSAGLRCRTSAADEIGAGREASGCLQLDDPGVSRAAGRWSWRRD